MSIRSDAAEKRVEDLSNAMIEAGKRLKGVTTTATCKVFVRRPIGIAKRDGHAVVVVVEKLVNMHVWPVGLAENDKFSELKFVPGTPMLVMLADVRKDNMLKSATEPVYFVSVTPYDIDGAYTGTEVRAISKLINNLQPYN